MMTVVDPGGGNSVVRPGTGVNCGLGVGVKLVDGITGLVEEDEWYVQMM